MLCPSCRTDNPADASFCEQCGAKLELSCPACDAPVNRGARFCRKCGSQLGERSTSTAPIRTEPQLRESPTGERRHLTMLFCDLAGSSGIAAQLDPEEWRETVSSYHRAAADAITRFGGHV